MSDQNIFSMKFSKILSLNIQKTEKKNITREEVNQIIC